MKRFNCGTRTEIMKRNEGTRTTKSAAMATNNLNRVLHRRRLGDCEIDGPSGHGTRNYSGLIWLMWQIIGIIQRSIYSRTLPSTGDTSLTHWPAMGRGWWEIIMWKGRGEFRGLGSRI